MSPFDEYQCSELTYCLYINLITIAISHHNASELLLGRVEGG